MKSSKTHKMHKTLTLIEQKIDELGLRKAEHYTTPDGWIVYYDLPNVYINPRTVDLIARGEIKLTR